MYDVVLIFFVRSSKEHFLYVFGFVLFEVVVLFFFLEGLLAKRSMAVAHSVACAPLATPPRAAEFRARG